MYFSKLCRHMFNIRVKVENAHQFIYHVNFAELDPSPSDYITKWMFTQVLLRKPSKDRGKRAM